MSEFADRYERVAQRFTEMVDGVRPGGWDSSSPCDGWTARDVVGHVTGWASESLLEVWEVARSDIPSVSSDPAGAWKAVDAAVADALSNPDTAGRLSDSPMGRMSFEEAVDQFCTPEVLVHSWDIARATNQDETLPSEDVSRTLSRMQGQEEAIRSSGLFKPGVDVGPDADEQTRLIAFTGRQP